MTITCAKLIIMAWLKKYSLNWPAPIYVLLGAAFPVLYLYAHNVADTKFGDATLPLGLCLAGAVVLWAVLTLIMRNARKAGLSVVLFLFFFFTYGRLYEALENSGMFVPKHAHLLPVMLFVWGYCVYFISRAQRDFRTTTTVLNVVAVALITINLFNIGSYQIELAKLDTGAPGESPAQAATASNLAEVDTLPDIYFICSDEYAHPDTMLEYYDYDNSEFFNSLEGKGFFIASQSETRSSQTPQCLAQVLNMEYLTPGMVYDASRRGCWVRVTASEGEYPDDPPWSDAEVGGWGMRTFCMNRHNGHVNGLFLDWSVRRIGLKELWTLKWNRDFDTANEWTKAGGVQPEDWPPWMRRFRDY